MSEELKPNATITITGPGDIINNEMIVIKKALEKLGYSVRVEDDKCPIQGSEDDAFRFVKDELCNPNHWRYREGRSVVIKMYHQPWGG